MESLPPLPKPTNSGSSRPDPVKTWRHTPPVPVCIEVIDIPSQPDLTISPFANELY